MLKNRLNKIRRKFLIGKDLKATIPSMEIQYPVEKINDPVISRIVVNALHTPEDLEFIGQLSKSIELRDVANQMVPGNEGIDFQIIVHYYFPITEVFQDTFS